MQQASASAQAVLVHSRYTDNGVQIVCGGSSIKGRRPQQEDMLLVHTDNSSHPSASQVSAPILIFSNRTSHPKQEQARQEPGWSPLQTSQCALWEGGQHPEEQKWSSRVLQKRLWVERKTVGRVNDVFSRAIASLCHESRPYCACSTCPHHKKRTESSRPHLASFRVTCFW